MFFNNKEDLKNNGFEGFLSIEELWNNPNKIPQQKGVYLVLNNQQNNTSFINPGVGGFFKGKNPNVEIEILKNKFVNDSLVIYIGKAGGKNSATLQSRIKQYLDFGRGLNVGHSGGRYIWQIKHYKDLIMCWKILDTQEPSEIESSLILEYETHFGRLAFANLRH